MTEKYPFFREEDETAQAVIGEDAIASDLNGAYQIFLVAPVAVLVIAVLSLTKMLRGELLLVEHLTGNFSFLLSQYPAEEIKNFADQVKRLQTEESIHA